MIQLYNTQTHKKEELKCREPGKVAMYACGPTVYNHIHIGNARTFLTFDIVRRWLTYRGYKVTFVQNVTDVDDKIINRAAEEGISPAELAKDYTAKFIDAMHKFGIADPDVRPKATEEIPEMIKLVQRLIDGGHAYEVDGDVYFSVRSFKDYGKLSGRNIDDLRSGARVDVDTRKKDPLDFALWKSAKPGEPYWASPWGNGRPGWHLECSAMSEKYLGLPIDIHGGGADLVFPHHENEIAQSEAACGCTFATHWLHGGMLRINEEKMSKSLGNFLLLKDILDNCNPTALRLLMLQTHYRNPLDFSDERLADAQASLERISTCVRNINWAAENAASVAGGDGSGAGAGNCAGESNGAGDGAGDGNCASEGSDAGDYAGEFDTDLDAVREKFCSCMDDDFNTAGALGAIFGLVNSCNSFLDANSALSGSARKDLVSAASLIIELLGTLGIELLQEQATWPEEVCDLAAQLAGYTGDNTHEAVDALLEARAAARAQKNFISADAIRDGLAELGFVIEDTANGARVSYGA